MANSNLIIKVKKVQEEGHGVAAWKIAYADFVTAMMAFFLLLWLLNAVERVTIDGISNYFRPTISRAPSGSGSDGMFGGISKSVPGPMNEGREETGQANRSMVKSKLMSPNKNRGEVYELPTGDRAIIDLESDRQTFNTVRELLEKSLSFLPVELENLKNAIIVDEVEDGLRIQIVDTSEDPIFFKNTDNFTEFGEIAIKLVADHLRRLPNKISISGHTTPDDERQQKWALSLNRANAARRALSKFDIGDVRFDIMIGKADREPFNQEDPFAVNNRRVSIVVLKAISKTVIAERQPAPSLFRENTIP